MMQLNSDEAKILNDFNNTLGFKTNWTFRQFMSLDSQIVALFWGNRAGKTVRSTCLITLYDGSKVKIKDVKKGDTILALDENMKVVKAKVLDWIDSGTKPAYKMTTQLGEEIVSSKDHGFLTVDGWKRLEDIKPGDHIATPRTLPINNPDNTSHKDWEYKLMGYLIGDGGLTGGTVGFTNEQKCTIEEIRSFLMAGYKIKNCISHKRADIQYTITHGIGGKPNFYLDWVRKHEMDCLSIKKFVPPFILTSSKRQIALFLSRLFSCDGCVEARGIISYCSASRRLIFDVKSLLLRFGIVVSIRTKHPKLNGKTFTAYELRISRTDDIIKFSEEIGIFSKQDKLDAVVEHITNNPKIKPNYGKDVVPVRVNRLYKHMERIPSPPGQKGKPMVVKYPHQYHLLRESRGKTIYRNKLKRISEEFNDEWFSILANSDVYWDKVISIEYVGKEPMCDLEIEGHHNYVAENIFSHNSHSMIMQYIYRFLSIHPVPQKNVVYLECESRYCKNGHKFNVNDEELQGDGECPHCNEQEEVYIDKFSSHKFLMTSDLEGKPCPECGTPISVHKRQTRVYRFCSENQPNEKASTGETFGDDGQSAETRNTLYPALKKWLPQRMIKKDITMRNPNIYLKDVWGGPDIIVEFVSYNQSVQSTAGFSLASCIAEGEKVLYANGSQNNIEKVQPGDIIMSYSPRGYLIPNKVKESKFRGIKEVKQVKCQDGVHFKCTSDHRMRVPRGGEREYIPLKDLNVGDTIQGVLPQIEGIKTLHDWQLTLLGILISDGCLTGKTIKFTCKNENLIKEIYQELEGHVNIRKQEFKNNHSPDYYVNTGYEKNKRRARGTLKIWLGRLELLGKYAYNKHIPDEVFRQPNRDIAKFLSYLYAGDGWASQGCIGYATTSERLGKDLHSILRRFKIRATLHERPAKGNWKKQWWVFISKSKDVINFISNIGIAGKKEYVEKALKDAISRKESRLKASVFVPENYKTNTKVRSNIKISSIQPAGFSKVYDLQMENEKYPNFVLNGASIPHNCALDEEAPLDFYLEQLPRLIEENGDLIIGCTPANKMTYYYDDVFLRASKYIRTPSICKRFNLSAIEKTDSPLDITVIQASSYDNPTLDKTAIKNMFANIAEDDQDTVNVRLYGMFSQASGRIFKDFKISTHVIDSQKYFKGGMPEHWVHGRFIDYHSHNPWACLHMSINENDEAFVWGEFMPKPDMPAKTTLTRFLGIGGNIRMRVSMVDPFAEAVKKDGISVKDDMQQYSREIVSSGIGTTANWQSWDTKSTRGRDNIIMRLKNSAIVKTPFNNTIVEDGVKKKLPTLWVLDTCPHTYKSLNSWKYELHANPRARVTKDDKEQPQQKHSHFCCCIEAAFKTRQFKVGGSGVQTGSTVADYFNNKYR